MPHRRTAVAIAALSVMASACGARVDSGLRQEVAAATLSHTGPGAAATSLGGSASGSSSNGGTLGSGGSGTNGGQLATTTGQNGAAGSVPGSNSGAQSASSVNNGGATDVGVTGNSISVGQVSTLSGPVPGLFAGAAIGTSAYFAYVNSQGGVFGRQLKLTVDDDQNDCAQNENAYRSLQSKVFAFVGSFSVYDNCGASVLKQHPDVPDVAYAVSPDAEALPNNFSPNPLVPGYATGMFTYWKNKYGDAVQHVGVLVSNVPAAVSVWHGVRAAAESVGWNVVYEREYAATETDFTADIVRMRQAGVKMIFLAAADIHTIVRLKQAADQQNFTPIFNSPVAYDESFVKLLGAREAEGVIGNTIYSLFFSPQDARVIPEVKLYQTWMQKAHPGANEDIYSMNGWAAGRLFVQALKAAGPRATRKALLAALRQVTKFDANGLTAPSNPAGKQPASCYVLWQIHNGNYVRVDTPAVGYRCDGHYFVYHGT